MCEMWMASNGIIFHAKFNEHRIAYSKQGKHRQSRSFYLRKEKKARMGKDREISEHKHRNKLPCPGL
jgi:hypothetical protein